MSTLLLALEVFSLVGAATILLYQARRTPRESLPLLGLILILAAVPLALLPLDQAITARGTPDGELWFLIALYGCLLLGMLAQHVYIRFSRPRRRRHKLDVGLFLAPVFASPIVFIPLLAVVQAAGVDLYQAHAARLMLFLIAFENGFFWKTIFDQRREAFREERSE